MRRCQLLYLLLLLYMAYFAVLYNTRETFIVFITIAIFPIISGILLLVNRKRIQVELLAKVDYSLQYQENNVIVKLYNKSILPIPKIILQIDCRNSLFAYAEPRNLVTSLMGKSEQEIEVVIASDHVGNIELHLNQITLGDLSGIVALKRKLSLQVDIVILPSYLQFDEKIENRNEALYDNEFIVLPNPGSDQIEIFNIREYIPGDRMSQIHWKLSNKYDDIMIKEFAEPLNYYPLYVIDLRSLDHENEYMRRMDTLFETFMTIAILHIEQEYSFTVAYLAKESLITQLITKRSDLFLLIHELYQNAYSDKEGQLANLLFGSNLIYQYSSCTYISINRKNEIDLFSKSMLHYVYIVSDDEFTVDSTVNGKVSFIHLEQSANDIQQLIYHVHGNQRGDVDEE